MDKDVRDHHRNKRFADWMLDRQKELPELARVVFSFRGHHYWGCGFQWAIEARLGQMIATVCDADNFIRDETEQIVVKVLWDCLLEEVNKIRMEIEK